jgi:hypothetical protein
MRVLRQTQKKTLTEVQPARCRDGSAVARAIRPFLARGLPSLTDHQWEYQIKNSAKRQPAGIPTTARRQHAAHRKLLKVGERGRNRTFNLLIFDQQPQTNAFNGFPSVFVVTNRQIYARLLPSVLPSLPRRNKQNPIRYA